MTGTSWSRQPPGRSSTTSISIPCDAVSSSVPRTWSFGPSPIGVQEPWARSRTARSVLIWKIPVKGKRGELGWPGQSATCPGSACHGRGDSRPGHEDFAPATLPRRGESSVRPGPAEGSCVPGWSHARGPVFFPLAKGSTGGGAESIAVDAARRTPLNPRFFKGGNGSLKGGSGGTATPGHDP